METPVQRMNLKVEDETDVVEAAETVTGGAEVSPHPEAKTGPGRAGGVTGGGMTGTGTGEEVAAASGEETIITVRGEGGAPHHEETEITTEKEVVDAEVLHREEIEMTTEGEVVEGEVLLRAGTEMRIEGEVTEGMRDGAEMIHREMTDYEMIQKKTVRIFKPIYYTYTFQHI